MPCFFPSGESIESGASEDLEKDNGWADASWNIAKGKSYLLNSSIDRFMAGYEIEKMKITVGRQRINWSQTLVWNPNDVFNAYSFFDFDYAERPGSDALRIQYYNTVSSATELAIKVNSNKDITAAALYRFNKKEYDIQLLGGILESSDYFAGTGWFGAIGNVSFRGEATYFQPIKNFEDTSGLFMASVSADYTFRNSLSLQGEFLYNSNKNINFSSFTDYYSAPLIVKNISFVQHSLFGQASYPID